MHAISAAIGLDTGLPREGIQGASGDKAGDATPDRVFFEFRASPYGAQLL
jgi:hypothetical protein